MRPHTRPPPNRRGTSAAAPCRLSPEPQCNLCGPPRHGRLPSPQRSRAPPALTGSHLPAQPQAEPRRKGRHLTLRPPAPSSAPGMRLAQLPPRRGSDGGGDQGRRGLGRESRWRPAAGASRTRGGPGPARRLSGQAEGGAVCLCAGPRRSRAVSPPQLPPAPPLWVGAELPTPAALPPPTAPAATAPEPSAPRRKARGEKGHRTAAPFPMAAPRALHGLCCPGSSVPTATLVFKTVKEEERAKKGKWHQFHAENLKRD